jgi:hypothetical protein
VRKEIIKLKRSVIFALIVVLFWNMLATLSVYADKITEIYLAPLVYDLAETTVSPGFKWNVTAYVRDIPFVNATVAYEVKLFFNTSHIEVTRAWIPKWDKAWIFTELTTASPTPAIDNKIGLVMVGDVILKGAAVSGAGPFLLAIFEFKITSTEYELPLHISMDKLETFLLNEAGVEISPVLKTGGNANYVWFSATNALTNVDTGCSEFTSSSTYSRIKELWDYVSDKEGSTELIVGLKDGVLNGYAKIKTLVEEYCGRVVDTISRGGKIKTIVAKFAVEQAYLFKSRVEAAGLATYIEPNLYTYKALMVPNDPYWQYQWGPRKIQADWAWNTTTGNASVLVAVVDTGIDYTHPDLTANYVALGYDWINNDNDPMDDNGHGTHVAGIIAAKLNNSRGIAGLAQVRIMVEKVLDSQGVGSFFTIAKGIDHAVNAGARIICMSLGSYFYSHEVYMAIKNAYDKGVLLIAAAGNEAISGTLYPAYHDEVIAVTATDQNDAPASFVEWGTNFGTWVELAAPGVDIYSTIPSGTYANMSGTSMACPHIVGVAALIWSRFPNMTRDHVRIHLRKTSDDLGQSGFDIYYGYGRVNAKKHLSMFFPHMTSLFSIGTEPPM